MLLEEVGKFARGEPHGNTQGFGFVRPGDDTAIVVRQYHHRLAMQHRLKQAFTRHVKVITVYEGK
jgi:hypothetical protein